MAALKRQKGLTLVELMVAMLMALFLSAGLFTMFSMSARNVTSTGQFAELQENARMALAIMAKDIGQTGFMADLNGVSLVKGNNAFNFNTSIATDCVGGGLNNASFPNNQPAHFRMIWGYRVNASTETVSCIEDALNGSDVIQIKRLVGPDVEPTNLLDNRFYFLANFNRGVFFRKEDLSSLPVVPDARYWQYQHHVYYIENDTRNGLTIPVLKRRSLTTSGMVEEPYVDGVEDMQILYGIDSDGDGTADGYTTAANIDNRLWDNQDFQRIVAIKIQLLLRALKEDSEFDSSTFSYQLGQKTARKFNDGYRRQVLSTTVLLENPTLLNQ
ncbi:PilW family protein [Paraferrimonas sedimenticola]|uniref:Type IV minor pilin protein PilW n=1 Tax=Paraferrimonas sedimenticola TaxID=375674 RepID=A0AA37RXI3_9GAMM|nr:PilW family protein [Paraferrimonas sedimenticola]GLP97143.1 type IV minor pilin protein PilW [Paraferrimonas sedimenticola]